MKSTRTAPQRPILKFFLGCSLSVTAVIFALVVCEGALRLGDFSPDSWPAKYQAYTAPFVASLVYAGENGHYQPHSIIPVYADGHIAFSTIDNLGYVGECVPAPKAANLLVFGDSFAYGFGVPGDRAFASLIKAYNAGVWGKPFPFHPRVFDYIVPIIRPQRAIWVIYPPHLITCTSNAWNTRTNIDKNRHPVLVAAIDFFNKTKLSTLLLKTTGIGYNRSDYYSLEWSLYDPKDNLPNQGYEAFDSAVSEIVGVANRHQIQIIPLFVPSKTQLALEFENVRPLLFERGVMNAHLAFDKMSAILEAHGIAKDSQIDLTEMMRSDSTGWRKYYFKSDAHLNELGHQAVATYVANRLLVIPNR